MKKIKTYIWGPSAWTFLHAVSFAYPEEPTKEHKTAALNLFDSLKYLLPCGECCSHYCTVLDKNALMQALENRDKFSRWVVDFHNSVNTRLHKPVFSYKEAAEKYLGEEVQCAVQEPCSLPETPKQPVVELPKQSPYLLSYVLCGVLGVLLLLVYLRNKK